MTILKTNMAEENKCLDFMLRKIDETKTFFLRRNKLTRFNE